MDIVQCAFLRACVAAVSRRGSGGTGPEAEDRKEAAIVVLAKGQRPRVLGARDGDADSIQGPKVTWTGWQSLDVGWQEGEGPG